MLHCFKSFLFSLGEPDVSLFSSLHHQSSTSQTARGETTKKPTVDQKDPDLPCFTKKEVRDIIFERNELKTNLFLVQEELSYYQRCVELKCFAAQKLV